MCELDPVEDVYNLIGGYEVVLELVCILQPKIYQRTYLYKIFSQFLQHPPLLIMELVQLSR